MAKGVDIYNSSQTQTLQIIAAQCPDELGTVVYKARAMYAMAAAVDMFDKSACNNSNNMEYAANQELATENVSDKILLYPNPANTVIYLQTPTVFTTNTKAIIYNNLGQIVKTILVNNETNLLEISTSELNAGFYSLQVSSETNPIVKQFIVIR